ncbi:MAG: TolC family protein [Chitinophagaceae bacterium]
MIKRFLIVLICTIPLKLLAQEKWDLRTCVEYAMKNNISVKEADVQARIAALVAKQAKLYQYPNINFSSGTGLRLGRSIDPTTNQFSTTQFLYQNFGLNGGVEIFNWGRIKSNISASLFSAQASVADAEKAANDIALNVATYYLQVLASKEQISIDTVQIGQTRAQYNNTKLQVEAGSLPELNLAELEAQLATDSTNLITAQSNYDQNLLSLKGLLSLDAATPFEIETPPIDQIPLENISELEPEVVFQSAIKFFPQQKASALRIKAAGYNMKLNKAYLYPDISFGYNLATNFSNTFQTISGYKFLGYQDPSPFNPVVTVGGTQYFIQEPNIQVTQSKRSFAGLWDGWSRQLNGNFGQSFGFQINIPIFNNGTYRINYERSKLDLSNYQLQKTQADLQLKQDIYSAYINARSSMQKYFVGIKSVYSAQQAYDFAAKRYAVGLLSTIDLLTNQNKLLTAKLQQLANQLDYVFRIKLLEFYKGQGLKL